MGLFHFRRFNPLIFQVKTSNLSVCSNVVSAIATFVIRTRLIRIALQFIIVDHLSSTAPIVRDAVSMTISSAYFARRVRLNDSDLSEDDNDTVIHNHDDLEPGQTVDGTFDIYFYMQIHLRDIRKLT